MEESERSERRKNMQMWLSKNTAQGLNELAKQGLRSDESPLKFYVASMCIEDDEFIDVILAAQKRVAKFWREQELKNRSG